MIRRVNSAKLKQSIEMGRNRMREAFTTEEMQTLRLKAFDNLESLGYFDPDNKQLQGFTVDVKNDMFGFDNPDAPEFIKFRITTTQQPIRLFVVTREEVITGKRFDTSKARFPFTAGGKTGMIFGRAGYAIHVSTFKKVLEKLIAFDKAPVKRPVK